MYKNFGFSHSGFPCFHDKRAGISKIFPYTQYNNNLKFSIIVNLFKKGKKAFSSHSITPIICFNRLSFLLLYDTYKKCKKVLAPPLPCFLQTRCCTALTNGLVHNALKLEKKCNFKSTKTHNLYFQKWQKINFCT